MSSESEKTIAEVRNVNVTRAGIYDFLSRSFKLEVDEDFIRSLTAIKWAVRLLAESYECDDMREANRLLHEFTEQVKELKGEDRMRLITNLHVEYAGLFLGASPKPVHLVESVYLGGEQLLYGKPYHEVLEAYRSLGFEKEKGFTEPEDHVAVEFQFMANLCKWTCQALENRDIKNALVYLNLQKEFLRDHIIKWVPDLSKRLEAVATSNLYKAIAHLTNGFITMDNEMLDHLAAVLKNGIKATK